MTILFSCFFGDHNTTMSYVKEFSKLFDLGLNVHNVPFFIHAPKLVQPKEIKKYTNLIDIIPTAAGLANIDYINYTLGTDALAKNTTNYSFLYSKIKGEPALTILKDSLLFTKTVSNNYNHLYNMNAKEYTTDIKKPSNFT